MLSELIGNTFIISPVREHSHLLRVLPALLGSTSIIPGALGEYF